MNLLAVYLVAGVLAIGGFFGYGWQQRHAGATEATAACELKVSEAVAEANGRASAAETQLERMRAEHEAERVKNQASRLQARAKGQEAIRANPVFAATARPNALHDQRLRELAEVRGSTGTDR